MSLFKRKTVLLSKLEATPGTDSTPGNTDGGYNAYDIGYESDVQLAEQHSEGTFSKRPSVVGARLAKVKFKIDAYGSGTAGTPPAWAAALLPACGFSYSTGVFSLSSSAPAGNATDMQTTTLYVFEDGLRKPIVGAMGSVDISGEDGKPLTFEFDFTGIYVAPTDVALPGVTRSTRVPARFAGATLSIGSYTPLASKISLKSGNVITMRQDVTQASGYLHALITDRNWTGNLDPEATKVATYDAYAAWIAGTTAALTVTVGSGGSGLTIAAPAVQYSKIGEGDRSGILLHNLDFMCAMSGATPDNELTITF